MNKLISIFSIVLLNQSCLPIPDMAPSAKILKTIDLNGGKLQWSNNSSAYVNAPDVILIIVNDKVIDTLCVATNVADIEANDKDKVIKLSFYGEPLKYRTKVDIPKNVLSYKVNIGTSKKE